ncbi:MAG TPA: zinc ribbon domain-containing protein [Vicinamibacterales bacterium]
MNSATSTDSQPLQPWQFFTLAGLVGATIVVFLSEGQTPAGIILLSLIIFGAAAVGAAAWRTFAPLSGLEEPAGPQIFGGRTRAALEREKSLVLRSIKDLEFDHAMGKVSDKDFAEMSARLRARAAGLIRQLDAGSSYRQAIEAEIEKRVGRAAPVVTAPAVTAPAVTAPAVTPAAPTAASDQAKTKLCLSCCTPNDPDARFCKGCGYQLGDW